MATCRWCDQDMMDPATTTCNQKVEYPDGEVLDPIPYTHWGGYLVAEKLPNGHWSMTERRAPLVEIPDGHRCRDCQIVKGGTHHPGCDNERCPRCDGQLISCGCLDTDEAEDLQ